MVVTLFIISTLKVVAQDLGEILMKVEESYDQLQVYDMTYSSEVFFEGTSMQGITGRHGICEGVIFTEEDNIITLISSQYKLEIDSEKKTISAFSVSEFNTSKNPPAIQFNLRAIDRSKLFLENSSELFYVCRVEQSFDLFHGVKLKINKKNHLIEQITYLGENETKVVNSFVFQDDVGKKGLKEEYQIENYLKLNSKKIALKKDYRNYTLYTNL